MTEQLDFLLRSEPAILAPQKNKALTIQASKLLGCQTIPDCSFSSYIERISHYTEYEENILIIAYDLLLQCLKKIGIFNPKLIHKLFVGCVTISAKLYSEDVIVHMQDLSKIYGVSHHDLLDIEEFIFFQLLECCCVVSEANYHKLKDNLRANFVEEQFYIEFLDQEIDNSEDRIYNFRNNENSHCEIDRLGRGDASN